MTERIARQYEAKYLKYDLKEKIEKGKRNILWLKNDGVDFDGFQLTEAQETFDLTPKVAEILEAEYRVLLWGGIEILSDVREADSFEIRKALEAFAKTL